MLDWNWSALPGIKSGTTECEAVTLPLHYGGRKYHKKVSTKVQFANGWNFIQNTVEEIYESSKSLECSVQLSTIVINQHYSTKIMYHNTEIHSIAVHAQFIWIIIWWIFKWLHENNYAVQNLVLLKVVIHYWWDVRKGNAKARLLTSREISWKCVISFCHWLNTVHDA